MKDYNITKEEFEGLDIQGKLEVMKMTVERAKSRDERLTRVREAEYAFSALALVVAAAFLLVFLL